MKHGQGKVGGSLHSAWLRGRVEALLRGAAFANVIEDVGFLLAKLTDFPRVHHGRS